MIGKFKNALYSVIGTSEEGGESGEPANGILNQHYNHYQSGKPIKVSYQRPQFLSLKNQDEIQVIEDHGVRPIVLPRIPLIWHAGYAETINAGKSKHNEDQASIFQGKITTNNEQVDYTYFGIFDGHAGPDVAVLASMKLHELVDQRLQDLKDLIFPVGKDNDSAQSQPEIDSLIIGALESAFHDMDTQIGVDKMTHYLSGGCTVLVALFILGKVFVANAGDSRALLVRSEGVYPLSFDFTPVSERSRLQKLGELKPGLLGSEFTRFDYYSRPLVKDIGTKCLVRDSHMTGWSYKEIQESDLKFPVVYGEGKRSRLLATIGVTRGFGDHDLKAQSKDRDNSIYIKPFLSSQPEVRVLNLQDSSEESDILIMGTDGLWDVVNNEAVGTIVRNGLNSKYYNATDNNSQSTNYKYVSIAQDLVMSARGKLIEYSWIRNDTSQATIDDISVFVIPLNSYKMEFYKSKTK